MKLKTFIKINEQEPVTTQKQIITSQQNNDSAILKKISETIKNKQVIETLNSILAQIKTMDPKLQVKYQRMTNSILSGIQALNGFTK